MGDMKKALDAVLAECQFDMGRVEQRPNGQTVVYRRNPDEIVPSGALPGLAASGSWGDEAAARARRANVIVPDDAFSRWRTAVEESLGDYINAETRTIGHAYPMESSHRDYETFEEDGISSQSYVSPVDDFAKVLVRGAAILGSPNLVNMLNRWLEGEPVRYRTSAVLNGLFLNETLEPVPGIRIQPLPHSTDGAFGSLPVLRGNVIEDFLGRSVLSVASVARPAFFRPAEDANHPTIRAEFDSGVGLEAVCQAVALEADTHVEMAFQWNDYEDASLYLSPRSRSTSSRHRGGLEPRGIGKSLRTDYTTGGKTVLIDEKNVHHLSVERLARIILAMARQGEASIGVAISRWCKSKEGFRTLADRFIDLRVALEALYLKNFDRKNRGEMKFRLALYGAWYVGSDFAERKATRKTLGAAYDMGSRAVHGDPLLSSKSNVALLSSTQALCRRGILKFLEEGVQEDWDNLVLGVGLGDGESRKLD